MEDVSLSLPSGQKVRATLQYDTGSDSTYVRPWGINLHFETDETLKTRTLMLADGSEANIYDPKCLMIPITSHTGAIHHVEAIEMPGFDRTPLTAPNPPPFETMLMPRCGQGKPSRPDILLGINHSAIFPKIVKRCNKDGHNYSIWESHIPGNHLMAGSVADPTPARRSCVAKMTTRDLSAADNLFFSTIRG